MEHKKLNPNTPKWAKSERLFYPEEGSGPSYPILAVEIDWARLRTNRPIVMATTDAMPSYLLKPEVIEILDAEKHPTYRLIMDLMWSTGAKVSEVLALTPKSFINKERCEGVWLKALKSPGRPTKKSIQQSSDRFIPIVDHVLLDRIQTYLCVGRFKVNERIFKMARQTVDRHIKAAVNRVGGAPFKISSKTFRHSFAIHLLLHGRPLNYVSQRLGLRSVESTEIYTNVLTVDGSHFMEGVDFH